jgi:prepilin-type N-terminal cleavage/methylation domain-containing protein
MFSSLKKLGFTMIELLIVIAVLGILAVAVLSAINPIEQINRGRDTGTRSDAEQLISATDRFYAAKGYYPWMTNGTSDNTWTDPAGTAVGVANAGDLVEINAPGLLLGDDAKDILDLLSSGGTAEIKASFVTRITDAAASNYLSIYNDGVSGESTYACFKPKSNSFREEAWKRCAAETAPGSGSYVLNVLPGDFPPGACPVTANCATASSSDLAIDCYICLP